MVQRSNFGGPLLLKNPILEPPMFFMFSLFLISTHSENLIHLALTVLKVQTFGSHLSGETPILIPPNFVRFFFLQICLHRKFHVSNVYG